MIVRKFINSILREEEEQKGPFVSIHIKSLVKIYKIMFLKSERLDLT